VATLSLDTLELPEREPALFITQTDLTHLGTIGTAWLVVTSERVFRMEKTPIGEEMIAAWPISELSNVRIEDLVDASA